MGSVGKQPALVLKCQQIITWANGDPVHWCIYESSGLHEMRFYVHVGLLRNMLLQKKLEIWKLQGWQPMWQYMRSHWMCRCHIEIWSVCFEKYLRFICAMKYFWNILLNIFSCDLAALWMVQSIRPSVRLSIRHTFFTMFPSPYHYEIFKSYYHWRK